MKRRTRILLYGSAEGFDVGWPLYHALLPGRDRPAVSLSQFFRTIPMIGERVSGRNPETLLYEADLHPSQQYRSRTGAQLD